MLKDEKNRYVKDELARQRAIIALMETKTIPEAAEKAGVGVSSIYKWMKEDDFQAELRAAAQKVYEQSLSKLAANSTKAANTLLKALDSENEHVALKAALGYFNLMANSKFADGEVEEARRFTTALRRVIQKAPEGVRQYLKEALRREINYQQPEIWVYGEEQTSEGGEAQNA